MKRVLIATLALGLAACGPSDRLVALQKEVAELQQSRIEKERVEKARQEADQTEQKLARAKIEREKQAREVETATKELSALQAAFEAEQQRNVRLRAEIEALAAEVQKLGARRAALAPKLDALREAAGDERDQADGFVRALRADEPEWARKRRMLSLRTFLTDLSHRHAKDPSLAGLAARAPGGASPAEVDAGIELAQRASRRLIELYELEPVRTATGAPAESRPPPVGSAPAQP